MLGSFNWEGEKKGTPRARRTQKETSTSASSDFFKRQKKTKICFQSLRIMFYRFKLFFSPCCCARFNVSSFAACTNKNIFFLWSFADRSLIGCFIRICLHHQQVSLFGLLFVCNDTVNKLLKFLAIWIRMQLFFLHFPPPAILVFLCHTSTPFYLYFNVCFLLFLLASKLSVYDGEVWRWKSLKWVI